MSVTVTPYSVYPSIPTGTIIRQPGSAFTSNRDGTCTLTETYIGNFADLVGSSLTVQGSANVEFSTLIVWSSKISQDKAGIGTLTVESRGATGGLPGPDYSLDKATHNEPLPTHPLWATQIAGTPSTPLNGAIFVDPITNLASTGTTAVFKGWTTGSIFEGVEDYLLAGLTYTISYASYSTPDTSQVGQTVGTPDNAPDAPTNYFWFYSGASYVLHGNVYRIQETYLLTGGSDTAATTILYGSGGS